MVRVQSLKVVEMPAPAEAEETVCVCVWLILHSEPSHLQSQKRKEGRERGIVKAVKK